MSEGTREHIVRQAAALFNRLGYAGAAMSDVIAATGVQKGGIYWHFGSKEELALEAFDHAAGVMRERLEGALAGERGAPARLHAFVDAWRGLLDSPPLPGGSPLLNTAVEADDGNAALRERARAALASLAARLRHAVLEGRIHGEFRADVDAYRASTVLLATLEGALLLARLHDERRHLDDAAAHLHEMVEGMRG